MMGTCWKEKGSTAIQSSVDYKGYPSRAVDGQNDGSYAVNGGTCTHTRKFTS